MKINKDNIEQWATWGGAVVCILLAVAVLLALGVGITRKAAQSAQPDPTLVAQRLQEILAGGTATPGAAPAGQVPQEIAPAQPMMTPTACAQMQLEIGERVFAVETVTSAAVPQGAPETAYFLAGSEDSPVFFLSPGVESLAFVNELKEGDTARVTWLSCNNTTYSLHAAQQQVLDAQTLNQAADGITIIVPDAGSNNALVVRSEYSGEEFVALAPPDPDELLAEIGLLGVRARRMARPSR
jgi:hypothetical protein